MGNEMRHLQRGETCQSESFADRLREIREKAGLSQYVLAKQSGLRSKRFPVWSWSE